MDDININVIEKISLNNPIFIEALPGIGHVGKLAADHLIDDLNATKFAEIHSYYFPPQVFINENGLIENMINEFYYLKDFGEDKRDYIILVGNTQGLSPEGQYILSDSIIDFIKGYGVEKIYTLGGLATGQPVENSKVFGAATSIEAIEVLKETDVEIRSADGGIVGASGLLLGLGKLKGINGVCLMAETPGYFIDAEAAEAILKKLSALLNITVDTEKLDERAEETRKMISKAQKIEQEALGRGGINKTEDDLRYIG